VPLTAYAELSNDSMIGPGVRTKPAYDGSDTQRGEVVPVIRYLGHPWFVRSTQGVLEGGARMELAPGLYLGAQVAYEPGRRSGDSDFLENRNVADVDAGASIGAQLEWDKKIGPMPFTLLARVRQHTESDRGAQADLRLSAGVLQSGRLGVGVFTQATWANAKSTRSFYEVTPQQSAVSGLPAYAAGSGLLFASAGLLWSFELTPDWRLVGNFEARRLQGDARGSPLTERSTNYYAAAGVAYRF
jgi:outer membrane scaffolding protein for murein synthesis (MipA/OmpV family)